MHIPDGLIPMDQAIVYWIITIVVLAIFFIKLSKKVNMEERLVLTAVLTAATVVATSLSIPSPFGIPMHFFLIPLGVSLSFVTSIVYGLFKNINGRLSIFLSTIFGILAATVVQIIILLLTNTTSLEVLLASLLPFYLVVAFIEAFINVIIVELIFNTRPEIENIEKV